MYIEGASAARWLVLEQWFERYPVLQLLAETRVKNILWDESVVAILCYNMEDPYNSRF
jgi:hypothetical protein